MKGKRLRQTLHLYLLLNPRKRMKYIKKQHIFAAIGDNCSIMDRTIPLYSNLIKMGNNVHVASKVLFITHDITHVMINRYLEKNTSDKIKEKIGCIEIGDNVFIGSRVTILQNVKIGSRVIIGAGTLVNKDIPDNSIVVGVPARRIGSFDEFLNRRKLENIYPDEYKVYSEVVDNNFANWLWEDFYKQRDN